MLIGLLTVGGYPLAPHRPVVYSRPVIYNCINPFVVAPSATAAGSTGCAPVCTNGSVYLANTSFGQDYGLLAPSGQCYSTSAPSSYIRVSDGYNSVQSASSSAHRGADVTHCLRHSCPPYVQHDNQQQHTNSLHSSGMNLFDGGAAAADWAGSNSTVCDNYEYPTCMSTGSSDSDSGQRIASAPPTQQYIAIHPFKQQLYQQAPLCQQQSHLQHRQHDATQMSNNSHQQHTQYYSSDALGFQALHKSAAEYNTASSSGQGVVQPKSGVHQLTGSTHDLGYIDNDENDFTESSSTQLSTVPTSNFTPAPLTATTATSAPAYPSTASTTNATDIVQSLLVDCDNRFALGYAAAGGQDFGALPYVNNDHTADQADINTTYSIVSRQDAAPSSNDNSSGSRGGSYDVFSHHQQQHSLNQCPGAPAQHSTANAQLSPSRPYFNYYWAENSNGHDMHPSTYHDLPTYVNYAPVERYCYDPPTASYCADNSQLCSATEFEDRGNVRRGTSDDEDPLVVEHTVKPSDSQRLCKQPPMESYRVDDHSATNPSLLYANLEVTPESLSYMGRLPGYVAHSVGMELERMSEACPVVEGELTDPTVYHGVSVPSIRIPEYLKKLQLLCNLTDATLIVGLIYAIRLRTRMPDLPFNVLTVHRITLGCMVLSVKFNEDKLYTNSCYGLSGGIVDVHEMNNLEMLTFMYLDCHLFVASETFASCCNQLTAPGLSTL